MYGRLYGQFASYFIFIGFIAFFVFVFVHISLKVVDSCWISSTEWSDTSRSFFVYGKKQESRKKYIITVQKNFTFLRRFDRKNTVLGKSRNLIDKLVFK